MRATSLVDGELLVDIHNHVAFLTFNRPQAMNALSFEMIKAMRGLFDAWSQDDNVKMVVTQGAGERAYCAGGDVRGLYFSLTGDGPLVHEDFFRIEYTLNYQMHRFMKATGKPLVALMDGIVMGGGMGVAQPSTLRIVGDRTKMAMPETKIGLFPDVGGTYFLSRCPGALGVYMALTSSIVNGADAIHAGLADLYCTREGIDAFIEALKKTAWTHPVADLSRLARSFAVEAPPSALAARRADIERHFSGKPSTAAIVDSLLAADSEWSRKTAAELVRHSPTMQEVTKRQIETGATLPLADCFRRELNMIYGCFEQGDIVEGIRALAIDKDNTPTWHPTSLAEVTDAAVDAFFAPRWQAADHPLHGLEAQFG